LEKAKLPRGRIAGIDYGTVRVGIAIADSETRIAGAHENYTRRTPELDARHFREFVQSEGVVRFVVGLPLHSDGSESRKSQEARLFGRWLQEVTGVPVHYFDERYTSAHAGAILTQAELTKKKRKARLDMLAAQIMLTAYLESPYRAEQGAGPIEDGE